MENKYKKKDTSIALEVSSDDLKNHSQQDNTIINHYQKQYKNEKDVKKRNWAFLVYPESAPSNWKDILQETGLQCVISPYHDRDINPDNSIKKPHYHIILCYSGPTSYNVVKRLTDGLKQPIPIALEQVKGYYRYLTHKDNPEKAQYFEDDIVPINGFNILDYVEHTKSEIHKIKCEIQMFIRHHEIFEYTDLLDLLLDNNLLEWHEVASSNTLLFDRYISSRRNKLK